MRKTLLVVFFIVLGLAYSSVDINDVFEKIGDFLDAHHSHEADVDPDTHRSFQEIVISKGYPLLSYEVTTADGYILTIFRIFGRKGETTITPGKPVLLICHGLGDSSDSSVVNSEELSLAFIAVNAGYDVWLINNRGNKHSLKHVSLSTSDKKYWRFSLHEMGIYDLPAVIEFIKKITGLVKITLMGHSQGGSQIFVLCSLLPDYCDNSLTGIVALAPAIYVDGLSSKFVKDAVTFRLDIALPYLGIYHMFGSREDINNMTHTICLFNHAFCDTAQGLITNDHPEDNNEERDDVMKSHYPSGMSSRSLSHLAAIIRNKEFLDYETKKRYPIENIKTKIYLFCGEHDGLIIRANCDRLVNVLKNSKIIEVYHILANFGHETFVLSKGQDGYVEKLTDAFKDNQKRSK